MKLSLRSEEGGVSLLQSEGEIRLSDQLRESKVIEGLLGPDCFTKKILLDLQNTPYMDSSGVSWLVSFHKHCREAGGVLILHSIPPSIMSILKLLHMDRYLNLVEDEQAAKTLALGGVPDEHGSRTRRTHRTARPQRRRALARNRRRSPDRPLRQNARERPVHLAE